MRSLLPRRDRDPSLRWFRPLLRAALLALVAAAAMLRGSPSLGGDDPPASAIPRVQDRLFDAELKKQPLGPASNAFLSTLANNRDR